MRKIVGLAFILALIPFVASARGGGGGHASGGHASSSSASSSHASSSSSSSSRSSSAKASAKSASKPAPKPAPKSVVHKTVVQKTVVHKTVVHNYHGTPVYNTRAACGGGCYYHAPYNPWYWGGMHGGSGYIHPAVAYKKYCRQGRLRYYLMMGWMSRHPRCVRA